MTFVTYIKMVRYLHQIGEISSSLECKVLLLHNQVRRYTEENTLTEQYREKGLWAHLGSLVGPILYTYVPEF